jgi:hypothetical protein
MFGYLLQPQVASARPDFNLHNDTPVLVAPDILSRLDLPASELLALGKVFPKN